MTILIIVESPAKCKKIEGFLGKGYKCIASFGHICQLNDVKKNDNYRPEFKLSYGKNKNIKNLLENIKKATEVVLATDDDREGEAIAWHICRVANLPFATTKRIIFHEITKSAILSAMKKPTVIDMKKVHAQLGRQVLDRIVGYSISPTLWKKFYHSGGEKNGLSAGRCQTPALRLIYDNQLDINKEPGRRAFETQGTFTDKNLLFILDKEYDDCNKMEEFLEESVNFEHQILSKQNPTQTTRSAPAPFSTSSLQQKASNELGFSPKRTMQLAQKLYEAGHITYMRTDNKRYSKEFIDKSTKFISNKWGVGENYYRSNMSTITVGKTKGGDKGAQEAHEAIRPTRIETTDVDMDSGERRLYKLIWSITVESCMADATVNVLTLIISAPGGGKYKHKEELVAFPGWMIVRGYDTDNPMYNYVKSLQEGGVNYAKITSKEGIKKLKSHYTEARLVQLLEKQGIGRPSTFSSLISKIQERGYVNKENVEGVEIKCKDFILIDDELEESETTRIYGNEKNKLVLQPIGKMVIEYLINGFDDIFEYEYTSKMEGKLDDISEGRGEWQDICRECDEGIGEKLKVVNKDKGGVKIDDHHTYMVSKWGPVVKYEKNGEITYKKVKKNLNIDKMIKGELNLESILDNTMNQRNLGEYGGSDVLLKNGQYGLYINHNEKNYSVKCINKSMEDIELSDVTDILSGKKSSNPNVLLVLNKNMSVRKGKFGSYIFYKTERMSRPQFFQIRKVLENEDSKRWQDHSPEDIVRLVNEKCL